jgi:5'' nucleotidase, deoxy (Pyrimidine), cytosolic type C protein (NT5C).
MTIQELEKLNVDKYFIDIDGVIFHSVEAMVKILNRKFNMNLKSQNVTSWNFRCCYPEMTDEEVEWLFSTDEFFDVVRFIEGAKDFLLRHKDNSILVTKGQERNLRIKRQFLDLNGLEDIFMIGLPLNVSKDIINMKNGVFIDDSVKNLNEVTTAKYKILFSEYGNEDKCEWSKGWKGDKMYSWN